MNEQTVGLLQRLSKNTEMGKNTLRALVPLAEDERVRQEVQSQLDTYEDLSRRTHAMLAVAGVLPHEQSAVQKRMAVMSLRAKTMRDRSARALAEMMITGSQMGVTDVVESLRDAPEAQRGAVALAQRVKKTEETYAQTLQSFL